MAAREIKGAIHVHSDYSDGSGTVEEIMRAAQAAGLDYVILTDHDNVGAANDGLAGRYGDALLVVGGEISPSRAGHCLALGDVDIKGYRWMPERYYLHKLRRDKADVYVAHPEGRVKPTFGINLRQWHVWESEQFTGLEIWSYMHDWVENLSPVNIPYYYLAPDKAIDGPDKRVLGLWDRLNLHRRVSGIGALDAHAVKVLFGALVAFPYERLFGTILTHAWVDEWGGDAAEDTARLLEALREGRAYVGYEALAPAEGFRFWGDGGLRSGDRGEYREGTMLHAAVPAEAEITLVSNGRHAESRVAKEAAFEAGGPGVFRVEARLGGRAWIFSNPIFLR